MRRLRSLFSLPISEQAGLLQALVVVSVMRLGLWIAPFRVMSGWAGRLGKIAGRPNARVTAEQIGLRVRLTSCFVPRATCLTQALAARVLMGRYGKPALLRIGVARGNGGQFMAHAWLEHRGRILVGEQGMLPDTASFPPIR